MPSLKDSSTPKYFSSTHYISPFSVLINHHRILTNLLSLFHACVRARACVHACVCWVGLGVGAGAKNHLCKLTSSQNQKAICNEFQCFGVSIQTTDVHFLFSPAKQNSDQLKHIEVLPYHKVPKGGKKAIYFQIHPKWTSMPDMWKESLTWPYLCSLPKLLQKQYKYILQKCNQKSILFTHSSKKPH